ncbi:MAG TPA: hypothetical protein VMU46_10790, partial [Burkholderiales bacterium]|nr:hypothetical protein [Burkholderiales bacterium]
MTKNKPTPIANRLLAYAISVSIALPFPVRAAPTDISDGPVTQPATTSMHPNVLLILDDSGSMARQFTPDYVSSNSNTGTMKQCFDSADTSNNITTSPDECWPGDPPAMSPDFNVQYYNPEIRYFPGIDYTGVQRNDMTAANTSNWTATPTDAISPASVDQYRKGLTGGVTPGTTNSDWQNGNNNQIDTMDIT